MVLFKIQLKLVVIMITKQTNNKHGWSTMGSDVILIHNNPFHPGTNRFVGENMEIITFGDCAKY